MMPVDYSSSEPSRPGDLQERFLYDELGAGSVLQERIRARIIQGSGRATRNAKDYATVVVIGDDLTNFVIRPDVLGALREELQAEIDFGRTQSLGQSIADVDENIGWFVAQTDEGLTSRQRSLPTATNENAPIHRPPPSLPQPHPRKSQRSTPGGTVTCTPRSKTPKLSWPRWRKTVMHNGMQLCGCTLPRAGPASWQTKVMPPGHSRGPCRGSSAKPGQLGGALAG